jgi:hypothetical protein
MALIAQIALGVIIEGPHARPAGNGLHHVDAGSRKGARLEVGLFVAGVVIVLVLVAVAAIQEACNHAGGIRKTNDR